MNRRPIVFLILLTLLPTGLIGFRLWKQDVALHGPSTGSGVVEGTEIALSSKVGARVTKLAVHEGQNVAAGDLVATLDCGEPQAQLDEAIARLDAARAQAEAASAQADGAERAAAAAKRSTAAGRAQADALAAQHEAAERKAGRLDMQKEAVTAEAVDESHASAEALGHQQAAAKVQADVVGLQAEVADEQARASRGSADAANAQVQAAEATVERLKLMVAECTVTAPRAAVVETLPWDEGEMVPPGGVVAKLVDIATVKATFYLPDAELAAAKPEMKAIVVADAYPDRQFAGVVTTVATSAEFTPRNVQTRTDRDRLVFPVEVTIPNPGGLLRPGMPVDITLPGTER